MGKLFFKKHGACFSKAGMELECFRENVRSLAVAVERTCSFKVSISWSRKVGWATLLMITFALSFGDRPRTSATPSFGDEYMGVMFGVIT